MNDSFWAIKESNLANNELISALKDMEYRDSGIHKKNKSKSLMVLNFGFKDKSFIWISRTDTGLYSEYAGFYFSFIIKQNWIAEKGVILTEREMQTNESASPIRVLNK